MKILVVEDDLLVADALRNTLSSLNYAVEVVNDGRAGLDCIEAFNYDLLLLDVILPELDGITLCRHVRSQGYLMPILLLTSKDSKHDRAVGLDAGADDYVVKPFDPEELSARIRALLRRGSDNAQPILTWEDLTLDPRNCEVTYQQQLLTLTPKEYALLELFLRHNRRLFSCGAILEHLWAYEDTPSEEAVRTHIKGLRHKLKAVGAPHDLVETVYGIGYRLKSCDPGVVQPVTAMPLVVIPDRQRKSGQKGANVVAVAVDSAPTTQPTTTINTSHLLAEIWDRHYDLTIERVKTISSVIVAVADRSLNTESRLQAWHSAHALAGTLGTFGLALGSRAAKEIELLLDLNTDLTPAQIPQLQSAVDAIRREIASKGAQGSAKTEHQPSTSHHPVMIAETATKIVAPTRLLLVTKESDLARSLSDAAGGTVEIFSTISLGSNQLTPSPDLIILDLDCFGDRAARLMALSMLDRDYPRIPVVVLSQPTGSIDRMPELAPTHPSSNLAPTPAQQLRQRIEIAGMGARMFLSKPIPSQQILQAIERVLHQDRVHRAKILIVDDDRLLLAGLSALLSGVGLTVTTLAEPSQFWETLEACTPDLLILDLDLPLYDGIELCQAVRTDLDWANLPIMFLTAHTAPGAIDRVFAAGADDFVTKPVVDSTLVTRILNRLKRK